jgi:glycosyltransferase involved in cell wall biosynthesis
VILEAQAARVPVVCTRLARAPELLEDGRERHLRPEDDRCGRWRPRSPACSPTRPAASGMADAGYRRVTEHFDIERYRRAAPAAPRGARPSAPRREAVA